jgi:hypothetical protein
VTLKERDGAAQEADRGRGLLVGEDLGIGQAGGVVDRDVDEVPARLVASTAGGVGKRACVATAARTADAMSGAADDPSELFDVDWISSPATVRS